jgi:hypothetical protein
MDDAKIEALLAALNPEERSNLLAKLVRSHRSHKRRSNPYAADIARVLIGHPGGLHRSKVVSTLEADRMAKGLPMPEKFEATVQSAYNQYSVDSAVFHGRGAPAAEGLFYSVGGKGSGYWAANSDRAKAWLARFAD